MDYFRKSSKSSDPQLKIDLCCYIHSQRRVWQPTPVFLLGESHEQRSLVGYSPCGHKHSNMTEQVTFSLLSSPDEGRH